MRLRDRVALAMVLGFMFGYGAHWITTWFG